MKFVCPKPAAITSIPKPTCPFKIEQIVGMALQRTQAVGASTFKEPTSSITDLATWTLLLAALASTKVTVTPLFANFVIPPSEGQEEGGNDNSTFGGIPIDLGEGAVKVTGEFRNLEPAIKAALDKLRVESQASLGVSQLSAFLFNRDGEIFHSKDGADPVGLPIYNFRVASRGSEGLKKDDKIPFSFYLPEGWDANLAVSTPEFNPLTQL